MVDCLAWIEETLFKGDLEYFGHLLVLRMQTVL